ncbi:MAG: hypothetical protein ACLROG_12040 [Coprococcus phoceensis]
MAYFLKKTNNKKGTYLQIYESYYNPERKTGAHRSYKPIGYVHELQAKGIEDPISFIKRKFKIKSGISEKKAGRKSPLNIGGVTRKTPRIFPIKNLCDSFGCKNTLTLCKQLPVSGSTSLI